MRTLPLQNDCGMNTGPELLLAPENLCHVRKDFFLAERLLTRDNSDACIIQADTGLSQQSPLCYLFALVNGSRKVGQIDRHLCDVCTLARSQHRHG